MYKRAKARTVGMNGKVERAEARTVRMDGEVGTIKTAPVHANSAESLESGDFDLRLTEMLSDNMEDAPFLTVGGDGANTEERMLRLERAANESAKTISTLRKDNQSLLGANQKLGDSLKRKNEVDKKREAATKMLVWQASQKANTRNFRTISEDVYSFLFCAPFFSIPGYIGISTVFMQFCVFTLFLANLLETTQIPANVEMLVRLSQFIAILVTFLTQTDIRVSLRALIYQEGVEETKQDFEGFSKARFLIANVIMFVQGILGIVVTLALIVYTNNVHDLLLNFTAVLFVSELDELVFYMARHGYLGQEAEALTKNIQECEFRELTSEGAIKYIHIWVFFALTVVAYIVFIFLAIEQESNSWLPLIVKAQFGDTIDPSLGLYSGCYRLADGEGINSRVHYVQDQPGRGQGRFTYCFGKIRSWTFTPLAGSDDDACADPYLYSTQQRPTSFNILNAKRDQWNLKTGNPVSSFQLNEVEDEHVDLECSEKFGNWEEELCPTLTMSQTLEGFTGNRDWSSNFDFMTINDEPALFFQHNVYVGEYVDAKEGLELIFFTGRRWMLTSAKSLLTEADLEKNIDFSNADDVYSMLTANGNGGLQLVSREAGAYSFISEAVDQASDRGTPLGLRWYHTRYAQNSFDTFPYAEISRPSDAFFSCGKCDSVSNPCSFEGACLGDGTCQCAHGATGKLCDIKPLSNGICNQFFNRGSDNHDGGDCCVSTCQGVSCGVGTIVEAFGQKLKRSGNGYPTCNDPEMVPLSIVIDTSIDLTWFEDFEDTQGGTFETYTLEVSCKNGNGFGVPIRVTLDPQIIGTSSETLYVADKMEDCSLKLLGIQSQSKFSASFHIFDGYPAGSDEPSFVMIEVDGITSDHTFSIPTLYAKCLKDTLKDAVDPSVYYSGSYQDQALFWLNEEIRDNRCVNTKEWLTERYAMVALWRAEASPTTWVDQNDQCLWSRITCKDTHPVVITHDGGTNGKLKGTVASEIGLLTHLERIDVFNNEFRGTLPSELGLLTKLTFLAYSENFLAGSIPSTIGQLKSLEEILLFYNEMTGTIPTEIGLLSNNLGQINFQENFLTGTLPSELGLLTALTRLSLHTNRFTGALPSEISEMTSLSNMVMTRNTITGSLPNLSKLTKLDTLIFYENTLSGPLPTSIAKLPTLWTLNLSTNHFTGTIPEDWKEMTELYWLIVDANKISGTIPGFLGTAYPNFSRLVLGNNQLTGSIPDTFANLSNMARILIQNNQLTGQVKPEVVAGWTSMEQLYLSGNQFTGTLPSEVGFMTSLDGLFMNSNQFTGTIPTQVGQLSALQNLDLSGNKLSGTIPTEIRFLTDLHVLNLLGGNRLTGTVPQAICDIIATKDVESDLTSYCENRTSIVTVPMVNAQTETDEAPAMNGTIENRTTLLP